MAETTCAIAASYPAKALGIRTGTLVHEARRLCPHVKLVQANHRLYVDYHHRILSAIDKHIPVADVMSIDEVACRLDKLQQQPTVARKLAQEIKHEIQSQVGACLTSSIGISANKLLAKLASNIWPEVPDLKPLRVGITLSGLAPEQAHPPDLFDKPSDARLVAARLVLPWILPRRNPRRGVSDVLAAIRAHTVRLKRPHVSAQRGSARSYTMTRERCLPAMQRARQTLFSWSRPISGPTRLRP